MSDYTLSYSRQKKLEEEETILDEEVNKAKVINSFDGTTLEGSLKELNDFVSDGSIRDWVISHPNMIIPVSFAIMLLIEGAILSLVALVVPFATHQPANVSMLGAVFALMSASIREEIFIKQNRYEQLKEKTLSTNYTLNDNVIDFPIEVKKELLDRIDNGFVYLSVGYGNHHLYYYTETDYTKKGHSEKGYFGYLPNAFDNEYDYFKYQLTAYKLYRISDIIMDNALRNTDSVQE